MESKVTLSLCYTGLISALAAMALTVIAFFGTVQDQVQGDLSVTGDAIAAAYDRGGLTDLSVYGEDLLRVTLVSPDGRVLYDTDAQAGALENHLSRPEIAQAISEGTGRAARASATLGRQDFYYARMLGDGNILRVSAPATTLPLMLGSASPGLLGSFVILLGLAVCLAAIGTRRIMKPVKDLPAALEDPAAPADSRRVYPELAPLVREVQTLRGTRQQMRQEFTANVSHELKTPLTTISGYAEMIETGLAREEDIPRFAGEIRREASRLLNLIADIIRLSQLDESAGQEIQREPVELLSLARECERTLEPEAARRGISLAVRGTEYTLSGNRTQLWELVYNLTENAIKYNRDNGSVVIEVGPGRLSVKDTGIGIPKEHQSRIFERFYRVDRSHSRATGGTGLGLSIVKHVAEAHNAKITVQSTVNVGTEITVEFEPPPGA